MSAEIAIIDMSSYSFRSLSRDSDLQLAVDLTGMDEVFWNVWEGLRRMAPRPTPVLVEYEPKEKYIEVIDVYLLTEDKIRKMVEIAKEPK